MYNRPLPVQRLVNTLGDSQFFLHFFPFLPFKISTICGFVEAQINTQRYGGRPYGVGLLVAGHDVRMLQIFALGCDDFVLKTMPSFPNRALELICTNSLLLETATITLPSQLEPGLSQPRLTLRRTLSSSRNV